MGVIAPKVCEAGVGARQLALGPGPAPRGFIRLAGELLAEGADAPVPPCDPTALPLVQAEARPFGTLDGPHNPTVMADDSRGPLIGRQRRQFLKKRRVALYGDAVLEGERKPPAVVGAVGYRNRGRIAEAPVLLEANYAQSPGFRADPDPPLALDRKKSRVTQIESFSPRWRFSGRRKCSGFRQ